MSYTLRLAQTTEGQDQYSTALALEEEGALRCCARSCFSFKLTNQDQEDLRWYLEDFLQYPVDPAPRIAARIESRMNEVGLELFERLFQTGDDTVALWGELRPRLADTRIEISTDERNAETIPWELMRESMSDAPLALRTRAFVRTYSDAGRRRPQVSPSGSVPVRILLVICRPYGRTDVPFRSVASHLVKGISESAREAFHLDVLRPPTLEHLARTLRRARAVDQPYHVVHFDGHGVYEDALAETSGTPPQNRRGYLLFENADYQGNEQYVEGEALGRILSEAGVSLLVMNACRSAHADPLPAPEGAEAETALQARAFGSLAQEVLKAGVASVVAMRYNVYVATAAQFVADLYARLAQGYPLGESVALGRRQLHEQPLRQIAYAPRPLQDWLVPVVYEAEPVNLFPTKGSLPNIAHDDEGAAVEHGETFPKLPKESGVGLFGRDETLLAIDRAFDTHRVVLLHAFAGSGKTSTACEFARWYAQTGGVSGPVLFTSFEQYKPLTRVIDQVEQAFGQTPEKTEGNWLALSDEERYQSALEALQRIPVLWIWDNVESVAGFPAGKTSAWSDAEQRELADFLRAASRTKAKFLLTSRRDEKEWLQDLPARVTLPPMSMQERMQLAAALAEAHGRSVTDVEDWRSLLRFTQGNPLTIIVLVGEALRSGLKTREEIEAFVSRLRAGKSAFEDEASEGRSKSLAASLSYGFEHAFDEDERKQLALLYLFQGIVNVTALYLMGQLETVADVPELRDLTRSAGMALLDRAAEVGLLTAHGGGYYSIHPALPWFFKSLFDRYYSSDSGTDKGTTAALAFVKVIGTLGTQYHGRYVDGDSEMIYELTAEESNLLHARWLACKHGWWNEAIWCMQGLSALYKDTGRRAEWARLVNDLERKFVDSETDGPQPGREEARSGIIEYRVVLAIEARQWEEAARLQRLHMSWERQNAAPALAMRAEDLDETQSNNIRTLAASMQRLGLVLQNQNKPEAVEVYKEAVSLCQRIGDKPVEAICAISLGNCYTQIPALYDLSQSQRWYEYGLKVVDEHDRQGRAQCLGSLGKIAFSRFEKAFADKRPEAELFRHLNAAFDFAKQALALLPPTDIDNLAITHGLLAFIYRAVSNFARALPHFREALRYAEIQGDSYKIAGYQHRFAIALMQSGRLMDAREYASAALRNLETCDERAAEYIRETRSLIAEIERRIQVQGGPSR